MSYTACKTKGAGKIVTAPCADCGHALILHTVEHADGVEVCGLCLALDGLDERIRWAVRQMVRESRAQFGSHELDTHGRKLK